MANSPDEKQYAGGFATQRGINYQNRVAAFFAACSLSETLALPILPQAIIESIRCETGEPLADILLTLENGGIAFIEIKRSISLTETRMKPVLSQVIQQYLASGKDTNDGRFPWRRTLDSSKDRLLLVTSAESPENVIKHLAACLVRIGPYSTPDVLSTVPKNEQERRALSEFHALATEAWKELMGVAPLVQDLIRIYSLFRIASLEVNPGEADEQHAQKFLATAVVAKAQESSKAWSSLVLTMAAASESRILLSRQELRRALLDSGFDLISSPSYAADIRALAEYTKLTLNSLSHLANLEVQGRSVGIKRRVTEYLRIRAQEQSIVVVGEPGAGKSGVLHELGATALRSGQDVVFLAADRLEDSLRQELSLQHDLADVLENWSNRTPGLLIIDALDAARGSKSLTVLVDLVRRVVQTQGSRWRVIASIREFDLRYSQDLHSIFRRTSNEIPSDAFQDRASFFNIRHIKIPRFEPAELIDIRKNAPELNPVFESASPALLDLLAIPFNLRLVAEIGVPGNEIELRGIDTQIGLLSQYWLHRVVKSAAEGNARELVLTDVLRALVHERRLTISKLKLRDAAAAREFSSLCSDNVLVEQLANLYGRNIIGFSHHLLFDYSAARLLIAGDFDHFLTLLADEKDLSLFLRPSIDLLFKEAWLTNRDSFWRVLKSFSEHHGIPAISKIIGPAVIPELARNEQDLMPLIQTLRSTNIKDIELAEQWIIHTIGAILAGVCTLNLSLWCKLSYDVASSACSSLVYAVTQSLVNHIVESSEREDELMVEALMWLSRGAIRLLEHFTNANSQNGWLAARTIGNVMDLFWVNPKESAQALRRLLTPDAIRKRGAEQGHWIARKVPLLFKIDPQLVGEIYIAFFGYEEQSKDETAMSDSRILALTSNRRQDYGHALWQLAQVFPEYLETSFDLAGPIVLSAMNSHIEAEHKPRGNSDVITYEIGGQKVSVLVDYSSIWANSSVHDEARNLADAYFAKIQGFAKSKETSESARKAIVQLLENAKFAYIPLKILTIVKACGSSMVDTVYPLLISRSALLSYDLSAAIGDVLSIAYEGLDEDQRLNIETTIYHLPDNANDEQSETIAHYRDTLLGCIPTKLLTLPEAINRVTEMAQSGGAPENQAPFVPRGFSVPYSEADRLRARGAPVDDEPNASLRRAGEEIWEFASKFTNSAPQSIDVDGIVPKLELVNRLLEFNDPGVHPEVRSSVEANLMAGFAAVAKWKGLNCSTPLGKLLRSALFSGLDSPIPEHDPEDDAQFDRSPAWGAPQQRIEAAAGIGSLLANKHCFDKELIDSAKRALNDKVPAVRFQIVTRLLPIHERDLAALWSILRSLAQSERSTSVLGTALYAVAAPLSGRYRAEVLELLKIVLTRADLPNDGGDAIEWSYRIATGLYLWHGDENAYALLKPVIELETFLPQRSAQCLSDIREALTFSADVPKESDSVIRKRAFGLVETIITSASDRVNRLLGHPEGAESEKRQHELKELMRLLDYIGNQLYFSSGAFDGTNAAKSMDEAARRTFWHESRQAITRLSEVAIPSIAQHLIEMLQSFIPFAPSDVFHAISKVVSSAKGWGYQYESMAVDLLVKVTERYLAEQRSLLLQDRRCREELMDILETFVTAGWPSARRLSYRLEEIFR